MAANTIEERFGAFWLRRTRDAQGRDVRLETSHFTVEIDPDTPTAKYWGKYGSEAWAEGRARGGWVDAPYAHDVDVDDAIAFDAWLAKVKRDLRGAVFFDQGDADHALLRRIWDYALEHEVLSPDVDSLAARAVIVRLARAASGEALRSIVSYLEERGLEAYLRELRTAFGRLEAVASAARARDIAGLSRELAVPPSPSPTELVVLSHELLATPEVAFMILSHVCERPIPAAALRGDRVNWFVAMNNVLALCSKTGGLSRADRLALAQRGMSLGGEYPGLFFNAACVFAQLGRIDDAMEGVRAAVAHGYEKLQTLATEQDLAPLRAREDFRELVKHVTVPRRGKARPKDRHGRRR